MKKRAVTMTDLAQIAAAFVAIVVLTALTGCAVLNPGGGGTVDNGPMKANFLMHWPNGKCPLVWFSRATSEADFDAALLAYKNQRYNRVHCYLFNIGDMDGKHPVNVAGNLAATEGRMKKIQAAGIILEPIVVADDSPGMTRNAMSAPRITSRGPEGLLAMFDGCQPLFKYFSSVIDGIELSESWSGNATKMHTFGNGLKARGFVVSHHTLPNPSSADVAACKAAWCDRAALQVGHPFTRMALSTARSKVAAFRAQVGKPTDAFEYDVQLNGAELGSDGWACGGGQ